MSQHHHVKRTSVARRQQLADRGAQMRHAPTLSEAFLFEAIRGGRLGVVVKRQLPLLGRYIADLFVPSVQLVIEVDGGYHGSRPRADRTRDRLLAQAGYAVLRLPAELVMSDVEQAVDRIRIEVARSAGQAEA
jgi:very-short-patch-repair endonuclease